MGTGMKEEISQEVLKGIIENTQNPMACGEITECGGELAIHFCLVNKAFYELYGDKSKGVFDRPYLLSEFVQMNKNDVLSSSILTVYNTGEPVQSLVEVPYIDKSFKVKTFSPYENYICVILADVTDAEKAKKEAQTAYALANASSEQLRYQVDLLTASQRQLESAQRIHAMVAQVSSDGFYYKNYGDGYFLASDSWYSLFTYDGVKPFDSRNLINAISDDDVFDFSRWRERAIAQRDSGVICEFRLCDNVTWIEATFRFIYDEKGKLSEEIGFFKDITTVKMQKEELAYKAYYDTTTGLVNRSYFTKLLDDDIKRATNEDVAINILYIDIDDFKDINDSIGYKIADTFISKFAMILKEYANETTRVARFDSDEFVISIYDSSRHTAQKMAMDIRRKLATPLTLSNGLTQRLTVSIGISQYPESGKRAVDLISNADIAMHRVKESGKNSILFFEETMLEKFLVRIEMEKTMKQALEDGRFTLYYQPQYYTASRKLRGMEALIRMRDDVLGFVPPAQFIPLAEKNGLIVEIGEWVLRRAFEDYMTWKEAYGFDGIISVNISPVQFRQVTFESMLYSLIKEYHMDPEKVEIEITESVFLEDEFHLVEMIKRIRNNGIKVSLDDFGTGYSSLSYLKNIPVDTLKIDKSFVDSLGEMKASDIITSSVIEMMQRLGMEIIAEGVETEVQYEFLRKMKCDNIQGFYLARPMNADSIKAVIREERC